jgi:class 3 adenylate cyclase
VNGSLDIATELSDPDIVSMPDPRIRWPDHHFDHSINPIDRFTPARQAGDGTDRVLTTVLFSDIVDSTRRAGDIGDHAWCDLLDRHDQMVRSELSLHRGHVVNTTGDGFFASFDRPGLAIHCGIAITQAVRSIGLEVRVGIHSGECELRRGQLVGIAVHIGARLTPLGAPGAVVVTSTVRDLVTGSRIEFHDLGPQTLKGVPGTWTLFAVEPRSCTPSVAGESRLAIRHP